MAREINISKDDLEALEKDLSTKREEMDEDQIKFLEHLISRARSGFKPADITWTWTYRF